MDKHLHHIYIKVGALGETLHKLTSDLVRTVRRDLHHLTRGPVLRGLVPKIVQLKLYSVVYVLYGNVKL